MLNLFHDDEFSSVILQQMGVGACAARNSNAQNQKTALKRQSPKMLNLLNGIKTKIRSHRWTALGS